MSAQLIFTKIYVSPKSSPQNAYLSPSSVNRPSSTSIKTSPAFDKPIPDGIPPLNLTEQIQQSSSIGDKSLDSSNSERPLTPLPPCTVKMLYLAPKHSRVRTGVMEYAGTEFSSENLQFLLGLRDIEEMLEEDLKKTSETSECEKKISKEQRRNQLMATEEYQELFKPLYETFIKKESPKTLNLLHANRKNLDDIYTQKQLFNLDQFKPARAEIEGLVDADTLKRYMAVGLYKKDMLDMKREEEIFNSFKTSLQEYLKINQIHKTSKGCWCCCGPDRTAIYANLESLFGKIQNIKPAEVETQTLIDMITFHQKIHLDEVAKNKHVFTEVFNSTVAVLQNLTPSLKGRLG